MNKTTVFGAVAVAVTVAAVWTSIAKADDSMVLNGRRMRPELVCPPASVGRVTLPGGDKAGPRASDSTAGGTILECRVVYVPVAAGGR